MEDMSAIVQEQADRLFAQHFDRKVLSAADAGQWPDALWSAVEDAGLPLALVPETRGGAGLAADAAANLIRRSAFHSLPLPLAETMIANALWTDAGGEVFAGAVTLAPVNPQDSIVLVSGVTGATLQGVGRHVAWGKQAATALVLARDANGTAFLCRVRTDKAHSGKTRRNVAYEPREDIDFGGVQLAAGDILPAPACLGLDGLMPFGAAIRVQQMIGGMERCMDYALSYANERVQFGRPIAKFQAIQHMLAIAAGHFAAASAAGDALTESPRLGDDALAVAIAKSRCGEAAGQVAALCHQVHGAMGFTQEHPLHYSTRRLWSWRDEWGAEPWWQEKIGRMICERGGEGFWPLLVDRPATAGAV
jgi:acyl-CoA dehydrogenase